MKQFRSLRKRQRGQGMTEYIIIVAVIAILSIVVVTQFGNQIRNIFFASGEELAGQDASIDDTIMDRASGADNQDLSGL
jgi:pilus assembly protein Flp/PilA